MARKRMISPDIWEDEKFSKLDFVGRLLFIGLITQANDYGKLRGNPTLLKSKIFPYDDKKINIEEQLQQLAELGLIIVYEVNGEKFIKIKNWFKHQVLTYKGKDDIPEPPEQILNQSLTNPEQILNKSVKELNQSLTLSKDKLSKDKIRQDNIINKEREKEIDKEKEKESITPNGVCQADKPLDATHLKSSLKSYEKTKKTISFSEWIKEIIDYLNQKTGKHFTYDSDAIRRFMKARYQEGYSVQDAKVVILHKCETWGKDDKMREYIRPSTLFRATHFPEYLAEARKWYLDYLEKQGNYEKKEELEKIWFRKEGVVCNK